MRVSIYAWYTNNKKLNLTCMSALKLCSGTIFPHICNPAYVQFTNFLLAMKLYIGTNIMCHEYQSIRNKTQFPFSSLSKFDSTCLLRHFSHTFIKFIKDFEEWYDGKYFYYFTNNIFSRKEKLC